MNQVFDCATRTAHPAVPLTAEQQAQAQVDLADATARAQAAVAKATEKANALTALQQAGKSNPAFAALLTYLQIPPGA